MVKILVLHGPNLNLLGRREPDIYGYETLKRIDDRIHDWADANDVEVHIEQSNHEGTLIDIIQSRGEWTDGIVLNPGGLSHTSICLHDAVRSADIPTVEVHLSNIFARESFRRESIVASACVGIIAGFGGDGYIAACNQLIAILSRK